VSFIFFEAFKLYLIILILFFILFNPSYSITIIILIASLFVPTTVILNALSCKYGVWTYFYKIKYDNGHFESNHSCDCHFSIQEPPIIIKKSFKENIKDWGKRFTLIYW
jgi:hypothetical protein